MTAGGLLVDGRVVPVPGVTIANARTDAWAKLGPGDYRMRRTSWTRQCIVHTTKGIHPQYVIPGARPGGRDKVVADFYRGDPNHNGAHAVADVDGTGACLADLATQAAYHAREANDHSWGLEVYQLGDGGLTEASIAAAIAMIVAGCKALAIPLQVHRGRYTGSPLARFAGGGRGLVGVFGHRDQTADRGRGDPGDIIMAELAADPRFEAFDFGKGEDLLAWQRRQRKLVALGERIAVDGVPGPGTMGAMRRRGFASGREIDELA